MNIISQWWGEMKYKTLTTVKTFAGETKQRDGKETSYLPYKTVDTCINYIWEKMQQGEYW